MNKQNETRATRLELAICAIILINLAIHAYMALEP